MLGSTWLYLPFSVVKAAGPLSTASSLFEPHSIPVAVGTKALEVTSVFS